MRLASSVVDTILPLSELSARDWATRVISGHSEATVVVPVELLGSDFANKVEDVAKDAKTIQAKQTIMKLPTCDLWHLFHDLVDVVRTYCSPHRDQVSVSRVRGHGHESGFSVRCARWDLDVVYYSLSIG